MKTCKNCKVDKELNLFHNHPATSDKKAPICKECANAASRNRYQKLKEDPEKFQMERERYNAQKRARLVELKKHRRK